MARPGSFPANGGIPSGLQGSVESANAAAVRQRGHALKYMPQLDSLRAIAVAGVMVHHLLDRSLLPGILSLDWGPAGVRLFFVLSGFLITSLLLESRDALGRGKQGLRHAFAQFYMRRTLRIFPLYYFVLLLALLFAAPSSSDWADPSARSQLPWLATYTYNLFVSANGTWPHYFGHFWTLSVEEQYYLLWPWVVLLAPRPRLVPIAIGLCVAGPIYRGIAVAADFNEVAVYAFPVANFDTLGMGSLLALLTGGRPASVRLEGLLRRITLPLGALGIFLVHNTALQPVFMDTLLALVFLWLVAGASSGLGWFGKTVLEWRPLVFTGRISYGLYVYHMLPPYLLPPLLTELGLNLRMHGYAGFVVSAATTFAVACASWFLLEAPINRLKRRFGGSRAATPASPSVKGPSP